MLDVFFKSVSQIIDFEMDYREKIPKLKNIIMNVYIQLLWTSSN